MRSLKHIDKHPKSGIFRFRPYVPPHLRPFLTALPGTRTLGTKDQAVAFRLALPHVERFQSMLADAEAAYAAQQAGAPAPIRITLADAGRLVEDWKRAELRRIADEVMGRSRVLDRAAIEEIVARGTRYGETRRLLVRSERGYADGVRFLREQTERVLAAGGFVVPPDHAVFASVSDLVRGALREIVDLDERWSSGDWTAAEVSQLTQGTPASASMASAQPAAGVQPASPLPPRRNPMRVSELMERHIRRTAPPAATEKEQRLSVRRLIDVLGGDLFVHEVDYAHAEEFYEVLLWQPRSRSEEQEQLPITQLAEAMRTGALQTRRVTRGTVDKQISLLSAAFRWARNRGFTAIEPFTQLTSPGAAPGIRRRPFREPEITKVFAAPLFTGCVSQRNWREPGEHLIADHRFWLPLLGLGTGARIEEAGQLLVTDVKRTDGVLYLDIKEEPDPDDPDDAGFHTKSLKTRNSIRRIPLHPILLDAGFGEFVQFRLSSGSAALFPELPLIGKKTKNASRVFNRDFLGSIGLTDPAARFHSFRHLFKDRARAARLPEEVHDALTGHANRSVGREYGEGIPITVLKEAIDKLTFPGYRPVPRRRRGDF